MDGFRVPKWNSNIGIGVSPSPYTELEPAKPLTKEKPFFLQEAIRAQALLLLPFDSLLPFRELRSE